MITGKLRSQIDNLWTQFWTGGITNPLTVIEQISFLMFARLLDIRETREERVFTRKHRGEAFPGNLFGPDKQHLRWSKFKHEGDAARMLALVRDELFAHIRAVAEKQDRLGEHMKDAQLIISKPSLLYAAVKLIDELPLGEGDTKGDLYEYLLSKLTTAGINGQFRTPRHIIDVMVAMVDPKPTEKVGDPAAGTAGFLVQTMQYLLRKYSSAEGQFPAEGEDGRPVLGDDGKSVMVYTGDLLEPYRDHIQKGMFYGFDFDVTMLRIAAMNLMLHDVANPHIYYQDTLSRGFRETRPELAENHFDVILANPPFKGSLDAEDIDPTLTAKIKTKKTELLFLVLMLRMLKNPGGRAAVIVPEGVLFGSSNAHVALRQMLVEENQLEAVISLPSGVFKPYAGVSTAILVFTRGGETTDVFFYDVRADGFSLDDKRERVAGDDLPDCLSRWQQRNEIGLGDRAAQCFSVMANEIRSSSYRLSFAEYKATPYVEPDLDDPTALLQRLRDLERETSARLDELEDLL
ncbi:MAG: SAM-dependent DNA methyltransferase [Chloroflexi bacterium CFX6]|nr:SAM-dependent DNA methyltransferase [Chloroflexi bacterium CFX6]MEB2345217.1 class I SAM-dependent DNA methyltransferase [Deltaproteobacteria bacterium]